MKKNKPKNRNPIARVVKSIRPKVIPDKKKHYDKMTAEELIAELQAMSTPDEPFVCINIPKK